MKVTPSKFLTKAARAELPVRGTGTPGPWHTILAETKLDPPTAPARLIVQFVLKVGSDGGASIGAAAGPSDARGRLLDRTNEGTGDPGGVPSELDPDWAGAGLGTAVDAGLGLGTAVDAGLLGETKEGTTDPGGTPSVPGRPPTLHGNCNLPEHERAESLSVGKSDL